MNVGDLARLPMEVATTARVDPNGEISWPIDAAEGAIEGLAAAGFVILGLDVRQFDRGGILETAWSTFEPDDQQDAATKVARAREEALAALAREDRPEFGDWVLITCPSPHSASA